MHPSIEFPGELAPIVEALSRPCWEQSLCHSERLPRPGEKRLSEGKFRLDPGDFSGRRYIEILLADLRTFMATAMGMREAPDGFPVRFSLDPMADCPDDACEAHGLDVDGVGCRLLARDMEGLRRAVSLFEDEMCLRRAPILPLGRRVRWTRIRRRISRSPIAPYRWLSGWELEDEHDYYPEAYLQRLAHSGVNAIWVAGLLRNLVASSVLPELGPPESRLRKLRELVAKTARYGIGVYFFCIEPRALPEGHVAGIVHPDILGAHRALCPSQPTVLAYVREAMKTLFTEVPDLAGVINIFNSERATTCWLNEEFVQACPRCRERSQAEVLAEVLNAFMQGIREASATADFLAWTYMMDPKTQSLTTLPIEPMLAVMRRSHPDIVWLGNFEHGGSKMSCGKRTGVHEYALSYVGPSPNFVDLARETTATGRRIYAKLQVGTSYELPTVPHVPVPGIVHEKCMAVWNAGATGTMLGWIPGGFPGIMLKAAGEACFAPQRSGEEFLHRLAGIFWGEEAATGVARAWRTFAEAWQAYPFSNRVLYFGPMVRGPAYQLHLERESRHALPYNWGLDRTRRPQPFEDDVQRWLGPFSVTELVACWRNMAATWEKGIAALEAVLSRDSASGDMAREIAVAKAVRLQCLAAADVVEFYAVRDALSDSGPEDRGDMVRRLHEIADAEDSLVEEMLRLVRIEPAIGFHTEMYAWSYSRRLLEEKQAQLRELTATLSRWETYGAELGVLERTVETTERQRPDRYPDQWGD